VGAVNGRSGSGTTNGSGPGTTNARRDYYPWRPQAQTRALLELVHAVMEEDAEHLPETIRQIYYALIGRHGYGKSNRHERALYRAVDNARRARPLIGAPHLVIPFEAIRDDGITVGIDHCYLSIADFEDETKRRMEAYRLDRQKGQRDRLEVWCEAAGMLPQLHRVAREYGVPVYSNGGANSSTGNWQVSRRALRFSGRTLMLHVGDFDPHGEAIFNALAEDVAALVEGDRTLAIQRVESVRVALTVEQVEVYGLSTDRLKKPKARDRAPSPAPRTPRASRATRSATGGSSRRRPATRCATPTSRR
jgi:hypothetical protein